MGRRKIYTERFNKQYKTYKKYYRAKERYFEKLNKRNTLKGKPERYHMREEMMSKSTYYANYKDYKRTLEEEGIKNPNVNQYIVSDQAYARSQRQYRALKRSLEKEPQIGAQLGIDKGFSEINFRTGNFELDWDELRKEYWYLKEELGYSSQEAKDEIANVYFGSE